MAAMPGDVRQHFMNGEHTIHHNPGLFNGIWSDMANETTFMRYGHEQSGIIGITLRPETVKTWAYSLHACNTLVSHLDAMRTQEQHKPPQTHHKEETNAQRTGKYCVINWRSALIHFKPRTTKRTLSIL